MTPTTDTLPPEVTLPLPRAFQDFVVQKQGKRYLLALALAVGFFVLLPLAVKSTPILECGSLILALNAAAWFATRHKTWHYAVNAKGINLFTLKPQRYETLWQDVDWKKDAILSMEPDEWRGLPALLVQVKMKDNDNTRDLWMVYAHEDRDTVTNVVLPLIEQYRQQYRHPLWADVLRQEKP